MNSSTKFLVCLYSEPSFLAINLLENLLANNCLVNIFTDNVDEWVIKTSHIAAKDRFNVSHTSKYDNNISYRYIMCLSGFLKIQSTISFVQHFLRVVDISETKAFIVLPKEIYSEANVFFKNLQENLGVIYVGDLLGPRIDLESDLKMSAYLNSMISRRQIDFCVGEIIYPLFVSDAARQIVKWLFAFGPYGKEMFLLGAETLSTQFWKENVRLLGNVKLVTTSNKNTDILPRNAERFQLKGSVEFMLSETYRWINEGHTKPSSVKKSKTVKTGNLSKISSKQKFIKPFLLSLLIIFLMPFVFVLTSAGLSYFSYSQFKKGSDDTAINLFRASNTISEVGYAESKILKNIPLVGRIYIETEYLSLVLTNISKIGISGIPLARTAGNLVGNILGQTPYSVEEVLYDSEKKLQSIGDYVAVLDKVSTQGVDDNSFAARYLMSKIDLNKYKQLVSQLTVLAGKAPEILGSANTQTYLVLFQNNMELRPTGGFIGSYGLLTFDRGRLSDFTISDVYSADGQLNGHVEPPTPINKYLGEANWWLRDSNWDPDFPTSAKRAEWFLDKEVDQQVDGVFAIDLYPIKDFLNVSGAIYLSDYDINITAENLYEKVQSEVQDNFFPGTHKKASFLTALSRSILSEMDNLSYSQKNLLLKYAYENLDQRHIQLFLHNADTQRVISNLNWDGSVFIPVCEVNCYSDLIGIVEANVGVNKANYFVNRDVSLNVDIKNETIDRTLTLTLNNSANINLGLSGRYKSYIRLVVPETVEGVSITSSFGQDLESLTPDITSAKGRKEIGVIVEVLAGETKQFSFTWSTKKEKAFEEYNLYFRKQAGIGEYPVAINVWSDSKMQNSNPAFSLTEAGSYLYNTTLVRDLYVRLKY